MNILENVALAPLTTFQIGGPARYFTEVRTPKEIKEVVAYARERALRFVILTGGSNVLVPDSGVDALVIRIAEGSHVFTDNTLSADAGCSLLSLIEDASAHNLGGWEKLAGIPGSIGGAVRGNAGAFGSEIKDFVTGVHAVNSQTLVSTLFMQRDLDFAYRDSFFKRNPEWIIMSVKIELRAVQQTESMQLIEETIAEREKRHLQNVRAAGSFFMNPVAPPEIVTLFESEKKVKSREDRVPAGWLIEKAGMKGVRVGNAIASEQHPNYLVNAGGATSADVLALAAKIKAAVQTQFGVELHEEAAIL